MKIVALALVLLLSISIPVAYHYGYKHGHSTADAEWSSQFTNDAYSDPSLRHSVYWQIAYNDGLAFGATNARVKMFEECGDEIIKITETANDPKALGEALVDGYVDPAKVRATAGAR